MDQENHKSLDTYTLKLSAGLLWLNERAWPLGGGILSLAGLYLYQYIRVEQVPLSITSAAGFTALPAIFLMLVFVISMLAASVLMPTFILFHRLNDTGAKLADQLNLGQRDPHLWGAHRRLVLHWGYSLLVLGFFWCWATFFSPRMESGPLLVAGWVASVLMTILAYVWIIVRVRPENVRWQSLSIGFWVACVGAGVVQLVVILMVTVAVSQAVSEYTDNFWLFLPFMFIELVFLFLIQALGACFVVFLQDHENPVAPVSFTVIVFIIGFGLIPAFASKLGGLPLQASASGGRMCTVMIWSGEAHAPQAVIDSNAPERSIKLRVLAADSDGTYIVRPWRATTKIVTFVPRASVAQLDDCMASTEPRPL